MNANSVSFAIMSPEMQEEMKEYHRFLEGKIEEFRKLLQWEVNTEELEKLRQMPDRFKEADCIADAAETFKCMICPVIDNNIAYKPVACSKCMKIYCKNCI